MVVATQIRLIRLELCHQDGICVSIGLFRTSKKFDFTKYLCYSVLVFLNAFSCDIFEKSDSKAVLEYWMEHTLYHSSGESVQISKVC